MKKYNLEDLKRIPPDEPLPDDVNEDAYNQASKLPGNISIEGMKFYAAPNKKGKFYGPYYAIGDDNVLYGIFHFIKGVCYKWDLVKYFGKCQAHVERFNENVYAGKNFINPNGVKSELTKQTQSEATNE